MDYFTLKHCAELIEEEAAKQEGDSHTEGLFQAALIIRRLISEELSKLDSWADEAERQTEEERGEEREFFKEASDHHSYILDVARMACGFKK